MLKLMDKTKFVSIGMDAHFCIQLHFRTRSSAAPRDSHRCPCHLVSKVGTVTEEQTDFLPSATHTHTQPPS